jgi:hypothetical protein
MHAPGGRVEHTTKVVYETIEEARAALIAKRIESCRRSLMVCLTPPVAAA